MADAGLHVKEPATSNSIMLHDGNALKPEKRKLKVLEEDDFTEKIEKIIERDYFPDLPKLKAQFEYQNAMEKKDFTEVERIKAKFSVRARPDTVMSTGQSFETPIIRPDTANTTITALTENTVAKDSIPNVNLDKFLANYTSEDNASFEEVMETIAKREKAKYPWLFVDETEANKQITDALTLPSIEEQASDDKRPAGLLTWPFKNKNTVMFYPEGAEMNQGELDKQTQAKTLIHKDNTRFVKDPFSKVVNQSSVADAATFQASLNKGHVGVDGKELSINGPQINGYGMVPMTPTPTPSALNDTPLMTWGEIEGTPFRLDLPDTPSEIRFVAGTPQFRIPETPARDVLCHQLADKLESRHRGKKQKNKGLDKSHSNFGASPKTSFDRINSMSPAARNLATTKLGIAKIGDASLRASYSPSPRILASPALSRTARTPNLTPTPSSSRAATPKSSAASLTDDLLTLPPRPKASDFF